MTDLQKLNQKVTQLATARNKVADAKVWIKSLQEAPEYVAAVDTKKDAETIAKQLDTDIRSLAEKRIDEGLELGHPALGKRNMTSVKFDETAAIQWAIEKGFLNLLKIDTTAFKKLAKSMESAGQPVPNVTITVAPSVTIAGDLSPWQEKEDIIDEFDVDLVDIDTEE